MRREDQYLSGSKPPPRRAKLNGFFRIVFYCDIPVDTVNIDFLCLNIETFVIKPLTFSK